MAQNCLMILFYAHLDHLLCRFRSSSYAQLIILPMRTCPWTENMAQNCFMILFYAHLEHLLCTLRSSSCAHSSYCLVFDVFFGPGDENLARSNRKIEKWPGMTPGPKIWPWIAPRKKTWPRMVPRSETAPGPRKMLKTRTKHRVENGDRA